LHAGNTEGNDLPEKFILEAEHLIKEFKARGGEYFKAVNDITFQVPREKPTVISLVGESGSGKTTTGLMVLGLLKPTSGTVKYEGKDIFKMSKKEFWEFRKNVQAIFQDPYEVYNPFYKADRILKITIKKFKLASSESEAKKLMVEALKDVNLTPEEALDKYPHQLSGGQRQRLMIARALLTRPRLIVADEPVSMVDASLRADILNTMLHLKKEYNISYLFITHDLSIAEYFSDRIIVMYRGVNVENGDINEVLSNPLHPYVKTLIESIPIPDPKRRWTKKIRFKIEDLTKREDSSRGCIFYSRCPVATKICSTKQPELVKVGKDHFVACHLYSK